MAPIRQGLNWGSSLLTVSQPQWVRATVPEVVRDAAALAKAAMEEYLAYRHPYMKTVWTDDCLSEAASGHIIAEIIPGSPENGDIP